MNIGVLTGGGDCPGLNAAIRAVVRRAITTYKYHVLGVKHGWKGLICNLVEPLTLASISGILQKGGTIISTSRVDPVNDAEQLQKIKTHIDQFDLGALVVIGDRDILHAAWKLNEEFEVNVVGIPKTINNDIIGTDYTIGFDTAVEVATEAIDRLHSTAESFNRVMVVEVMGGRHGWIAVQAGIASGADYILIPEQETALKDIEELIQKRHDRGKDFSIIVVADGAQVEGYNPDRHHGGVGEYVGQTLASRLHVETRTTKLGHIQRGGTPTASDRVQATRLGIRAVDNIAQGAFGIMVGVWLCANPVGAAS